jgi:protein involved in polysaccharide export with SLBB domain
LEDEIERRLKADDFLVSPQVGVQLATYRPFYILGETGTPGSFEPVRRHLLVSAFGHMDAHLLIRTTGENCGTVTNAD